MSGSVYHTFELKICNGPCKSRQAWAFASWLDMMWRDSSTEFCKAGVRGSVFFFAIGAGPEEAGEPGEPEAKTFL